MSATAANLRELHQLHQRAKALRDRMASGPKTLAARQTALATRQAALDAEKKAHQDARVQQKKHEHSVQSHQARIDDLRIKLNAVKKNEEYKAIQNQIAVDQKAIEKLEGQILEEMMANDEHAASIATQEAELKKFSAEVAAFAAELAALAASQSAQLRDLEAAVIGAEEIIPEELRDRYRRTVKQYGADALAFIESNACSGCYVSVTPQMVNELINVSSLIFCNTCGRVLYLAEEDVPNTRRTSSAR